VAVASSAGTSAKGAPDQFHFIFVGPMITGAHPGQRPTAGGGSCHDYRTKLTGTAITFVEQPPRRSA